MNRNQRAAAAAIPVVGVNVVAFAGQLAFLHAHLHWHLPGQILTAAVLESIAVYLAWQAHLAQLANDSALRLRLAAYGWALLIAAMNYSHFADGWRPTFAAVVVALCSAISPWLWGIHTRRVSRDALMARGLIEPHALRLGATRWVWHPWRSARVMFHATWDGETDPVAAIHPVYPTARTVRAVPAAVSASGSHRYKTPPQRELMTSLGVGQGKARRVQEMLRAASNGHGGR